MIANGQMKFHAVCTMYPDMTPEEFAGLCESIRKRGQQQPCLMFGDEMIDGKNRYRACQELGIPVRLEQWNGKEEDLIDFVEEQNEHRRHMTASQRATVAATRKKLLELLVPVQPKDSVGRFVKNDDTDSIPRNSRKEAAEKHNVSEGYVHDAEKIQENSPETFEKVKQGEISIPEAKKQLGLSKPKPKGQCRVNGVLQDDTPEIAKQRAKGKIAEGVIPEITTVNEGGEKVGDVAEERDERAAMQDADSDETWLATLPLTSQLTGHPLKIFTIDALFYRHIEPARKTFGKKVAELLNKNRIIGGYGHKANSFLISKPPKDWKKCPPLDLGGCDGTGQVKMIGQCSKCHARGYLIF